MKNFTQILVYLRMMIVGGLLLGSSNSVFAQWNADSTSFTIGGTTFNTIDHTTPSFTEVLRQYVEMMPKDNNGVPTGPSTMTAEQAGAILKPKETPYNVVMTFNGDPSTHMGFSWFTNAGVTVQSLQFVQGHGKSAADFDGVAEVTSINVHTPTLPYNKYLAVNDPDNPDDDSEDFNGLGEYAGITSKFKRTYESHKVLLTTLFPGTAYSFRVGNGTSWSDIGTFTTATNPSSREPFSFIFTSDPQGYRYSNFDYITKVSQTARTNHPTAKFWIGNGDFVESAGDDNAEWEWERYIDVQQNLFMNLPFAPTIGNHDVSENNRNYFYHFNTERPSALTWPLPNIDNEGGIYSYVYGDALIFALNFEESIKQVDIDAIATWMKSVAAENPNVKWRLAYFHQGIYPATQSHVEDASGAELRQFMAPVFDELKIDLVLQGNDHVYGVIGPVKAGALVEGAVVEGSVTITDPEDQWGNANGKSGGTYDVTEGTLYFLNNTSGTSRFYPADITDAYLTGLTPEQKEAVHLPDNFFSFFTGRYGQTTIEPGTAVEEGARTPTYSYVEVGDEEITITTYEVNVFTGTTASSTVYDKIIVRKPNPNNTKLDELTVSANQTQLPLTPPFDSEDITTENPSYTVTVPETVTSVVIAATPDDERATVTGTGEQTNLPLGVSTFPVTVTAADKVTSRTYNVKVHRVSNNLSALTVTATEELVLDPVFNPAVTLYKLAVDYAVEAVTIAATRADELATFVVNPTDGSVDYTDPVLHQLVVGNNSFYIIVKEATETGAEKRYRIDITRGTASADANLSSLTVSQGTLSPEFDPAVTNYTVDVPNEVTSITITGTSDAGATIVGNGDKPLNLGANVFNLLVTPQNESAPQQYTVTVNRAFNANKNLSALNVNIGELTPEFDPATTNYTVDVGVGIPNIVIEAKAEYATAKVSNSVNEGNEITGTHQLVAGSNIVTLTVTAEDGTTQPYIITVNRAASDNGLLKTLTVRSASGQQLTLTPMFDPAVHTYDVQVGTSSITIEAAPEDAKATAVIDGDQTSLTPSVSIPFTITVTAEDNSTTTYTVNVTQAGNDNAKLQSVTIPGATITGFSPDRYEYTVNVPYRTTAIAINAATVVQTSTYAVAGVGNANVQALAVGANVFNIVVTAQAGNTQTYVLTVNRADENSNRLSVLTVSGGTLVPAFNAATFAYTVNVGNNVTTVNIGATPAGSEATVTGAANNLPVQIGDNTFNIDVTPAGGGDVQRYTITVKRAESNNTNLRLLQLSSGTLTPAFAAATTTYTVSVLNSISSITVTANAEDAANAAIEGSGKTYPLEAGVPTPITITVRAQNGQTKTYTITATRALPVSNIAELTGITVDGVVAAQSAENPLVWDITVDYTTSITIDATPIATATINPSYLGVRNVQVGANPYTIQVRAEDGITTADYTLNVTVREQPNITSTPESELQPLVAYPNPASDNVTINGLNGRGVLTVYDVAGRQWIRTNIDATQVVVPVSSLPRGIYTLQVIEGNQVRTVRIVVD